MSAGSAQEEVPLPLAHPVTPANTEEPQMVANTDGLQTAMPSSTAPPPPREEISKEDNAKAMLGDAASSSWTTPNGDVVTVKAIKAIALWSLKVGLHETCPICRESLQTLCVQCQAMGGGDEGDGGDGQCGEQCRVAQLPCGHLFHHHCVSGWLRSRDQPCCPTCQAVVYSTEDIQFL